MDCIIFLPSKSKNNFKNKFYRIQKSTLYLSNKVNGNDDLEGILDLTQYCLKTFHNT